MDKIMKLVLDIMQLGIEISKNTTTDVFVNYSGHVDLLEVYLYKDGWEEDKERYYSENIYLDKAGYQSEDGIIETLQKIRAELENLYTGVKEETEEGE
jgi:hypothetical protein